VLDVAKVVDCEGCQLIDTNYLKKYVIINIMIITKLQFQKNLVFVGRPYRSLLSRKANSLKIPPHDFHAHPSFNQNTIIIDNYE
jgi:hypothetical protein